MVRGNQVKFEKKMNFLKFSILFKKFKINIYFLKVYLHNIIFGLISPIKIFKIFVTAVFIEESMFYLVEFPNLQLIIHSGLKSGKNAT